MFASLVFLVLVAKPTPAEIRAPLGAFVNVVSEVPKKGVPDTDKVVVPQWAGCEPQGVFLHRFLGGAARALEQLQRSLDEAPGAEKALFVAPNTLGSVLTQLQRATFEPKKSCVASALGDGYRLELANLPLKWCPAEVTASSGEFWFFSEGKAIAVISVQPGKSQQCAPRLSSVLFDASGTARVRLHSDWAGQVSATLVGDRCRQVDYALDATRQVFSPKWKNCKKP